MDGLSHMLGCRRRHIGDQIEARMILPLGDQLIIILVSPEALPAQEHEAADQKRRQCSRPAKHRPERSPRRRCCDWLWRNGRTFLRDER